MWLHSRRIAGFDCSLSPHSRIRLLKQLPTVSSGFNWEYLGKVENIIIVTVGLGSWAWMGNDWLKSTRGKSSRQISRVLSLWYSVHRWWVLVPLSLISCPIKNDSFKFFYIPYLSLPNPPPHAEVLYICLSLYSIYLRTDPQSYSYLYSYRSIFLHIYIAISLSPLTRSTPPPPPTQPMNFPVNSRHSNGGLGAGEDVSMNIEQPAAFPTQLGSSALSVILLHSCLSCTIVSYLPFLLSSAPPAFL
jgi:hypothetical protein